LKIVDLKGMSSIEELIKLVSRTFLKAGIVLKCEEKSRFHSVVRFSIMESTCRLYPFGVSRITIGEDSIYLKYCTRQYEDLIYKIVDRENEDCHFMGNGSSPDWVIISLTKGNRKSVILSDVMKMP
jgi:hypothetical protein